MKVILLDNVEGVGKKGETREVRDGFGRNFLVPRGLGVDGKLFGSVTAKEVAEAAKKAFDIDIDRRVLRLGEPLKMTGAYTVEAHLEKGIVAQLRLEIEEA
ncbi:MAG: 50S ribosomal L9 C-terminal domain-containing protein [Syntrophorhabdales bacterium]